MFLKFWSHAQLMKNQSVMQEMRVQSLGREDPLEKEMATHSILAWRISQTEEPGRLQSMGSQRVRHDRVLVHFKLSGGCGFTLGFHHSQSTRSPVLQIAMRFCVIFISEDH